MHTKNLTNRELHVIVRVPNGYGRMSRSEYESLPKPVRARVDVLAVAPTEAKAKWLCDHLPQTWDDVLLAWDEDSERADVLAVEGVLREVS